MALAPAITAANGQSAPMQQAQLLLSGSVMSTVAVLLAPECRFGRSARCETCAFLCPMSYNNACGDKPGYGTCRHVRFSPCARDVRHSPDSLHGSHASRHTLDAVKSTVLGQTLPGVIAGCRRRWQPCASRHDKPSRCAGAQAGTYSVSLMVTDWLGQTDSTTWGFTKAAAALPLVQLVGGAQQSFTISQGIAVPAQIFLQSVCAGAALRVTRMCILCPW